MDNKVKFAHYRIYEKEEILGCGGVTLAIQKLSDTKYRVAGAKCSLLDRFNKKVGRLRSIHRLAARWPQRHVVRKDNHIFTNTNWVELTHNPSLEDMQEIAELFFSKSGYKLVHSGLYFKKRRSANNG